MEVARSGVAALGLTGGAEKAVAAAARVQMRAGRCIALESRTGRVSSSWLDRSSKVCFRAAHLVASTSAALSRASSTPDLSKTEPRQPEIEGDHRSKRNPAHSALFQREHVRGKRQLAKM